MGGTQLILLLIIIIIIKLYTLIFHLFLVFPYTSFFFPLNLEAC